MARPQATPRAIAVARGDEPADLLITGGRVFSPARASGSTPTLAIADGVVVGWGERDALDVVDVGGAALTPGFVDAHMHLESTKLWIDEFVRTVLPHGHDRGRRRPARDRERARRRRGSSRSPRSPRRCRSPSACPRRAACRPRRSRARARALDAGDVREPARAPRRDRRRGGHELPRRDRRRPRDAGRDRRRRSPPRRRARTGRVRPRARRLPRRRRRVRPRVHPTRGGRREAPQGHVGVHPPGLREPEPRRADPERDPPRARARRVLHRRPRARHAAARAGTSTTVRGWRSPPACSEIDALLLASTQPGRATTASSTSGASAPATRPTSSASTSSAPGSRRACGRRAGSWRRAARCSTAWCPRRPCPTLMRDTMNVGAPPAAAGSPSTTPRDAGARGRASRAAASRPAGAS